VPAKPWRRAPTGRARTKPCTARLRKPKESKLGQAERRTGPLTVPGTRLPALKRPKAHTESERRMDTDYDPDSIAGRLPEEVRSGNDSVHALTEQGQL
jgi:hypothetical protein